MLLLASHMSQDLKTIPDREKIRNIHAPMSLYKSDEGEGEGGFKGTFIFRSLSINSKADVSKTPLLLQVLAQKIAFFSKVRYLVRRLARILCQNFHG